MKRSKNGESTTLDRWKEEREKKTPSPRRSRLYVCCIQPQQSSCGGFSSSLFSFLTFFFTYLSFLAAYLGLAAAAATVTTAVPPCARVARFSSSLAPKDRSLWKLNILFLLFH